MTTTKVWKPDHLKAVWELTEQFQEDCCYTVDGIRVTAGAGRETIALDALTELHQGLCERKGTIYAGPLVTYEELMHHPLIQREAPLLAEACRKGLLESERQMAFAVDVLLQSGAALLPLLLYDAVLIWALPEGVKQQPLEEWLKEDASEKRVLLAVEIHPVPVCGETLRFFRTSGKPDMFTSSRVTAAGVVTFTLEGDVSDVRLAAGSGHHAPVRLRGTEDLFRRSSARKLFPALVYQQIKEEFIPPHDLFASSGYQGSQTANLIVKEWQRRGRDHHAETVHG
ncbi:hypothetical protein [Alkalicoccus luteus]|uniref:hypothetical protein n=1 Tax=Alkalicoccus luteus TaxID=1237094 RepID=UPI004033C272